MANFKEIQPTEVAKIKEGSGSCHLIDVRNPEEYSEVHAVGAVSLPLPTLSADDLEKLNISKSEPVYFICRSGARSATACNLLAEAGYQNLFNVVGGTLKWIQSGLSVHESETDENL